MKNFCLSLLIFLFSSPLFAQTNGHSIKVRLKGTPENKTCYLAHYYGSNQYIKVDSTKMNNGILEFTGNEKLKGGVYLIVISPSKYYDFLIDGKEQKFELESDTADFVKNLRITGSKENNILFEYRKFLAQKNREATAISASNKEADATKKEQNRKKMEGLSAEVEAYMKNFVKKNEGTFAASIVKANIDPEMPKTIPTLPNGKKDSTYAYYYYKNHYFDNIDFSDERILRTPFLETRLEKYFKDLVYQKQDSVIKDCDKVLMLSKKNQDVYRYVLWFVTHKYEVPEIIGLDGVFIHLSENYYLKDANWLDSTQRAKFIERVTVLKPLQTGLVFPSLIVEDSLGKEHSPLETTTKYTIVYFYSHDCGHCKESAPKLVEFAAKNKGKVTIFNVDTYPEEDKKREMEFINTYKTQDLLNLWDRKHRYYFRNNFDVFATPTTYILDENHRIIAKRIPIDELERYLDFYENQLKIANK